MTTCCTIDGVAIDLSVAIDVVALAGEMFVFGMYMVGVGLRGDGAELTTEIGIVNPQTKLIGVVGGVSHTIVDVVVGDARTCAEGYLTTVVGKEVDGVVMAVLDDGELTVKYHPMDKVGELTETASYSFRGLAVGNGEAYLEASSGTGPTDELPNGEGLARMNENTIDMGYCQCEVGGFVFLQLHIDNAELATDE